MTLTCFCVNHNLTKIVYKTLYLKFPKILFILSFPVLSVSVSNGQERIAIPDTVLVRQDTAVIDTVQAATEKPTTTEIDDPIDYEADDSLIFDLENDKVYLYGNGFVTYQDIELRAAYIELDRARDVVFAMGTLDSLGREIGKPVFKDGSESFESKTLTYNFKTKKGIIQGVITEQEGGYLHSGITKKHENGEIHVKNGKYTTCDLENPHFYVALTKAKVIPDDKIVSGPAYLVMADIPLPIALPFGFFPNQKSRSSGILIPEYGEERNRGFFFRNGGYYLALSDYFDARITGDIYTRGTWGVSLGSNYRVRYRFNGNLRARYYMNVSGEKELPDYTKKTDYSITWSHSQDPKSNPSRTFNANVNMSSSSFDRNHSFNANDYLTNTKQSSISYSKRWAGSPFNLSASMNHRQNSQTNSVDLNLPKMNFNMNRIYPLKRKNRTGKSKWYENIELSYKAMLDNQIKTTDSLLFTSAVWDDMKNAFKHDIPLSTQIRPFNSFYVSPSLQYSGVLYSKHIEKRWEENYYDAELDSTYATLITDTIRGLRYAHSYLPTISLGLNPKIYGMYVFKNPNSRIEAVRHVMTPSVSFSYTPDMTGVSPDYYRTVQVDTLGNMREYSLFEQEIYRTPTLPGRSGSVNIRLSNNIEMKVRSTSDTAQTSKKVKILENLSFSTNYNLFADSLKWSPITMSGRTRLANKVDLTFGGTFDPYALSEDGRKINKAELTETGKLARLTRFNFSINASLNSRAQESPAEEPGTRQSIPEGIPGSKLGIPMENDEEGGVPQEFYTGEYVDFSIPWNLSLRYNYNYTNTGMRKRVTQTFNFSGNVSLTEKWKIGFSSGYDFKSNKLTYTSVNIYRDLHCWEMRLSWIPIGYHQSYSFQINVKSAILKDLKYEKRKSWYDR